MYLAVSSWGCRAWEGKAWRLHASRYEPDDPGGSYRISGRYNRGKDYFEENDVFPALYLATAPEVSLGEKQRHMTSGSLPQMRNQVLSEFQVSLQCVYDLSKPEEFGIDSEDLIEDRDYALPQSLSAALRDQRTEAFLVPSATLLGVNLVVFPDLLRDGSSVEVLANRKTRLYVEGSDREL